MPIIFSSWKTTWIRYVCAFAFVSCVEFSYVIRFLDFYTCFSCMKSYFLSNYSITRRYFVSFSFIVSFILMEISIEKIIIFFQPTNLHFVSSLPVKLQIDLVSPNLVSRLSKIIASNLTIVTIMWLILNSFIANLLSDSKTLIWFSIVLARLERILPPAKLCTN